MWLITLEPSTQLKINQLILSSKIQKQDNFPTNILTSSGFTLMNLILQKSFICVAQTMPVQDS